MRTSKYLLSTLKNTPLDSKIISHQLMLRSGMIKKISSGLYIWLPTGIRVLKKIVTIIKKEIEKIDGLEMSMPIIQPISLWQDSGRLTVYGEELLKFFDRRNHQFVLGPTNEEIVTNFIKTEIHSYKELPLIIYQIQTKFRDEIRPRFGVIRAREFIMKDAYSFHTSQNCLEKTYYKFYDSYTNIFAKIKLKCCTVKADSGSMGGNISHEFQAFSENGEDEIVFSDDKSYSTNMNMAQSIESINFFHNNYEYNIVHKETKTNKSIISSEKLNTLDKNKIKTILIRINTKNNFSVAALLIRADHEFNLFKIEKINMVKKPVVFLNEEETILFTGIGKKFLGPYGLKIPIIADISTCKMTNFTIGANINNHFFINMNWNIDLPIPIFKDIRKVTKYDLSPNGSGYLNVKKSIEIGHIFQLNQKYSKQMNASIKTKNGSQEYLHMGCYGIGITRIPAAIIEQNHDKNGIIWPDAIAPFEVVILPINMYKSMKLNNIVNFLYEDLIKNGIDVILDDRNERPGIMFNEFDLIGIPHQIIISTRSLNNNNVEYRTRKNKNSILIHINEIKNFIIKKLKKNEKIFF